ncbi:MAG TPA: hypothetical protein VG839_03110 [Asticcacaulis sp.]|nr:hypothetical protein [Asticcacaulis sp.]
MSNILESVATGVETLGRTSEQFVFDFGRAFSMLWTSNPFLALALIVAGLLLMMIAGTSFARR